MGPTAAVYFATDDLDVALDELALMLDKVSAEVRPTRKGRVWDIWVAPSGRKLTKSEEGHPVAVRVTDTEGELPQHEDALLSLNLLPEDVPYVLMFSAGFNGPDDREILEMLSTKAAELLGGTMAGVAD